MKRDRSVKEKIVNDFVEWMAFSATRSGRLIVFNRIQIGEIAELKTKQFGRSERQRLSGVV